jgi:LysR family hydrogen peroxide-inducible transcriptional activator
VELAHIRYFVALCEERQFTRAAQRCRISQPSLSNGIKTLERELGGKLFERSGMSLTPLGKSLYPQFESALASIGQITKRATAGPASRSLLRAVYRWIALSFKRSAIRRTGTTK